MTAGALRRLQTATGCVVEALADGKKDGDRVRAAVALLDPAFRGVDVGDAKPTRPTGAPCSVGHPRWCGCRPCVCKSWVRPICPVAETARRAAALADSLSRASGVDVLDKRLRILRGPAPQVHD